MVSKSNPNTTSNKGQSTNYTCVADNGIIMEELWKDIKGYEGCYKISNTGKVLSLKRILHTSYHNRLHVTNERILKSHITRNGYELVSLNKDNKKDRYLVHRLVAEAFIPNPKSLPQVNHKDENKLNNHIENLEWCTAKYNGEYSRTLQKAYAAIKRKVTQYTKTNVFIKTFESATYASRQTGIKQSSITLACQGKYKTAGGYVWKYYEDDNNK